MNVMFICHEYPPGRLVGGIGIFVRNISKALVRSGHKVSVIGLYNIKKDVEEEDDGVEIYRIAMKRRLVPTSWLIDRLRMFKKISSLIKEKQINIIETSDFDAGYWMAPKWNTPRVVRLNGGEVYFRTLLNEKLKSLHKWRESNSITKADAIASVSKYTLEKTRELFELKDNTNVILENPVDTNLFKPSSDVQIIKGRIVYTGTVIRKKGVLDLAATLPFVFDKDKDAHLIMAGSDSMDIVEKRSTWQLFQSRLPTEHHTRVKFLGRLEHRKIIELLLSAEVCVYPSYLEAFPNAWIEAMSCQKAVVASSTGSGPEVITDGLDGFLCNPSDHLQMGELIIKLLKDPNLNAKISKQARKRALEIDIHKMTERNLAWYNQVINQFRTIGKAN